MRCPNCQTINPPNAKFCQECGNRLVVCPNCHTVNLPMAKFCIECGIALQSEHGAHTGSLTRSPINAVTVREIQEPLHFTSSAERRVVTVMFADITGSTPLADRLDPEDMRAILTGYFNLMTEQIRRHGGTVEKYIGDAVMAVFGVPIAHEDDPDRAMRAALDMQKALAQFNQQRQVYDREATHLQMRIGINTGEVAAPSNVTSHRQDFLVTGDAVNIAARLQQSATSDTILVGERTYLSARDRFIFQAIAPLRLKGKPEPIMAYVVAGQQKSIQHPRGSVGRQAPLVGRTLELTLLHASYARVQAERRPHLITILGIPGVGKSRLVREFIVHEQKRAKSSAARGGNIAPLILKGRCPPYGEGITYWPLIEILRGLLHAQDNETNEALQQRFISFVQDTLTQAQRNESAAEIADILLRQVGRGLSGEFTPSFRAGDQLMRSNSATSTPKQGGAQGALLRAWRVLLESLGKLQPLIIVVDDLQWADDALLELLEYLTDRISSVPVLFLCPARPDFLEHRRDWGGGHRNFTAIELESLAWDESSKLVDALLNAHDLPEALRSTILTRAEGNPFFVEEIIRMLIDQEILVREDVDGQATPCWRIGYRNDALLNALSVPGELPDDTLIEQHYLLPLPHVPDTIQGVLAARVDLLNPTEKLILQHAAIIGRTFWFSTLRELALDISLETVMVTLVSLIKRDFIVEIREQGSSPAENDRYFSFKHILIRDVVYSTIPRMRRSREHAQLAFWLEEKTADKRDAFIELLAYHYQRALASWSVSMAMDALELELHDPTSMSIRLTRTELRNRTIYYLTMTGDQALSRYYTLRALHAYNDAFELLLDSHADALTRCKMLEKVGDAYTQRGNLDEAWRQYRRALQLVTEEASDVDNALLLILYEHLALLATRWLARFNTPPDAQEVRGYINTGLHILEREPLRRERIAFLTYQAFWYIRQLESAANAQKTELAELALASGQEALHLAEELNNPPTLSLALDAMSFIYDEYHQHNEALVLQQRRQRLESLLADREELYDLYISLGRTYEQIADYPAALMWYGRAWGNAQTMESPAMLLSSLVGRMRTWKQWNRWDDACEVASDILQLVERYQQDEKLRFWALETLATIAYQRGDQERGDQYARQCKRFIDQQIARSNGKVKALLATKMHAIHLAQEDWVRAALDYKEKLRASEPFPSPELLATLAELLVKTGESGELQMSVCERAIAVGEQSGARKSFAIAMRARGCMYLEQNNWRPAENDLRQALQACKALDLPLEQGHTLYYLGMLYQRRANHTDSDNTSRRNDLSRARYHFEQALGFYALLHAKPALERVRRALMSEETVKI